MRSGTDFFFHAYEEKRVRQRQPGRCMLDHVP
jgi:hypothetical protein